MMIPELQRKSHACHQTAKFERVRGINVFLERFRSGYLPGAGITEFLKTP